MQYFKNILIICCIAILSGCAGMTKMDRAYCVFGTVAAGTGIGTAVNPGGGTVAGLIGGAVGSVFICKKKAPEKIGDSDGDGVNDNNDACPNTPAGVAVDSKGCPRDDDGDGVANYKDQCPGTPRGVSVDNKGCPLDDDKDGVANYLDECPGTPHGVKVNSKGCPEAGETLLVLHDINFAFDSSKLDAASRAALDQVVQIIKSQNVRLNIIGYTDSIGSAAYNQTLSKRRAEAVRAYLLADGIDASRLTASGKGEDSPIASNKTREGRAKNRRVEFVVSK